MLLLLTQVGEALAGLSLRGRASLSVGRVSQLHSLLRLARVGLAQNIDSEALPWTSPSRISRWGLGLCIYSSHCVFKCENHWESLTA